MNRSLVTILALAVLALLLAAGCAPPPVAEAAQSPTATPTPDSEEAAPAQSQDSPASGSPQAALLPAATRPDSNCIACHSNAEQLQLLAEEEEAPPSLSEGSG